MTANEANQARAGVVLSRMFTRMTIRKRTHNGKGVTTTMAAMIVIAIVLGMSITDGLAEISEAKDESWVSEITIRAQKAVSAITKEYGSAKPSASEHDIKMAKSLRSRAMEDGMKGNSASIKKAIFNLHRSLGYQYSREALIEMAYYFCSLGHLGNNPRLNFIRSNGILDALQISKEDGIRDYVSSRSVRIMNSIRMGNAQEARKDLSRLRKFERHNDEIYKKNQRFLEAWFHNEEDWTRRLSIVEDLLRLSPETYQYYNYKGVAYYHAGDHELARYCFERAAANEYLPAVKNLEQIQNKEPPKLPTKSEFGKYWKPESDDFPYSIISILTRKTDKRKAILSIKSEPEEAKIKVLQIALGAGRCEIEVSSEGYIKQNIQVALKPGEQNKVEINLKPTFARLYVNTDPEEAMIKILNIREKFYPGIELDPGRYELEVYSDGHVTKREWVELGAGEDKTLDIRLREERSTLSINTVPEKAEIKILNIGKDFYQDMELDPGRYHLAVLSEGYETVRRWVEVKAGEDKRIKIILEFCTGRMLVQSKPSGAVWHLDGKYHGITPQEKDDVKPGTHIVKVLMDGYKESSRTVEVIAGQQIVIDVELEKVPSFLQEDMVSNSLGMEFVYIKPGSLMMGSPSNEFGRDDDENQHRVTLTKGFFIQTTEVTQGQWVSVMGKRPWRGKSNVHEGNNYPAVYVTWEDCQKFIRRLNKMEKTKKYRLPTEAEWEYACRAGGNSRFGFGDNDDGLGQYGWYLNNAKNSPNTVAQKKPNGWGLFDMHGNVWEWCQNWYARYPSGTITDPKGASSGRSRVNRGGGWMSPAMACRSANRDWNDPGFSTDCLGFRLARTP